MLRSICISLVALALIAGVAGSGLFANFSDTETSTGNTFSTAACLDIEVDSDSNSGDGEWAMTDLTDEKFFNRTGANAIAPGDKGEVTISLHLTDGSDSWDIVMKMLNYLETESTPVGQEASTEPEAEAENGSPVNVGEKIEVILWVDDYDDGLPGGEHPGDNYYHSGVEELKKSGTLRELNTYLSSGSDVIVVPGAVAGTIYYLGLSWELPCATDNNVVQDDSVSFDIQFCVASGCP